MRLLQLVVDKINDWLDPLYSLFGQGTRAEQVLLENLARKLLNANREALPTALAEFKGHLDKARLHKLVFASEGPIPLLMQFLKAAEKVPGLWPCLQDLAKRKFKTPLEWDACAKEKEEANKPTSLGLLISLAYQGRGDVEATYKGAQELLLTLVNSQIPLNFNACVSEEDPTTALWVLTAAAHNGQPWAVGVLPPVIKQFNQILDWNVCSQIGEEEETALALTTALAINGSPQYLEEILKDEVVFSRLNVNAKLNGVPLVEALLGKPKCLYLASWILLAAKTCDEAQLGEKGKALSQKFRKKAAAVRQKIWILAASLLPPEALSEEGIEPLSFMLPDLAKEELKKAMTGIPPSCQTWIIQAAVAKGIFHWQAKDAETALNDLTEAKVLPASLTQANRQRLLDAVKTLPRDQCDKKGVKERVQSLKLSP